METSNQKRARLLGEPFGTANGRLRKMLLFDYAQRCNEDTCYRCQTKIDAIEDFSIEHTIAWQGTNNPRETFFDISNIKFSHLGCNSAASYHPQSKNAPVGKKWCSSGKHFKDIEEFHKNAHKPDGLSDSCAKCKIILNDAYRRNAGLRPSKPKFLKGSKYN